MKRLSAVAMALLLTGFAAVWHAQNASGQANENAGWITLLDVKNLDNWTKLGDANWHVDGDALVADKSTVISNLVSKESWTNFQIKAEIWVDAEANSGIYIRATDPAKVNSKSAYEVNVFDKRPDPTYATGSIVDVAKASTVVTAADKWNTLEIEATAQRFSVVFNGTKTVDGAFDGKFPSGHIALQYGKGVVKFRKVELKKL